MNISNNKEEKKKAKQQLKVGITEVGFDTLNLFLESLNKLSKRKIRAQEVVEFAVGRLSEKDIPRICEKAYTGSDKVEVLLEKLNSQLPDKAMSKNDLLSLMVQTFEASGKAKLIKSQAERANEIE